jgi:asparagine synthase (glutamine-hydrolysing)
MAGVCMPGISLLRHYSRDIPESDFHETITGCLMDKAYKSSVLWRDSRTIIGASAYPEYPITSFDIPGGIAILEGRVYGIAKTALQSDVESLVEIVNSSDARSYEVISSWLLRHDGDYVLVIVDKKSGCMTVINDALGRLPLYVFTDASQTIVSREIGFAVDSSKRDEIDRTALAQQLVFGYPLGVKTIYDKIMRVPPAAVIRIERLPDGFSMRQAHEFNLDEKDSSLTVRAAAEELLAILAEGCRNRADRSGRNIVSLGGGLDSRAVVTSLKQQGVEFSAFTFNDGSPKFERDARTAERIAHTLCLNWKLIRLRSRVGSDADLILRQKRAILSPVLAFDVPYMAGLLDSHTRDYTHISGDGGDKLLPCLNPPYRLRSTNRLTEYIAKRFCVIPLELVVKLTRVSREDILGSIYDTLDSYPESCLNHRHVRFVIYERGMKWLFEGEDRNRYFFWSTTPYYSLPFFRMALSLEDKHKRYNRLYREFLTQLSPDIASIVDANRLLPVTSPSYRLRMTIIYQLSRWPGLMKAVRDTLLPQPVLVHSSLFMQCLVRQLIHCKRLDYYFDTSVLQSITEGSLKLNREMFENVISVALMIERNSGCGDSLRGYLGQEIL